MNSRERVIRTLKFEEVDRLPRDLLALPGVKMQREGELREVLEKYSQDIERVTYTYNAARSGKGSPYKVGNYTDLWGSVWHVGEPGVAGEVKEYPLLDWQKLDSYKLPWELLDEFDPSDVNRRCEESDKFVLANTETRPFERMQFLRGTENILMDIAYGEKAFYKLKDMLHEFFIKEMNIWANTGVDGVTITDDWGTQISLLISPDMWREIFKPLYKDYCDILHARGKYVFFHSDGNIESIYPDLIEIGIDAINSQLFCMDIEKLGELYGGKITFWGEIDRQQVLPFGTREDVTNAVRRITKALIKDKRTGFIARFEWGVKDPKENIVTVLEELNKY